MCLPIKSDKMQYVVLHLNCCIQGKKIEKKKNGQVSDNFDVYIDFHFSSIFGKKKEKYEIKSETTLRKNKIFSIVFKYQQGFIFMFNISFYKHISSIDAKMNFERLGIMFFV